MTLNVETASSITYAPLLKKIWIQHNYFLDTFNTCNNIVHRIIKVTCNYGDILTPWKKLAMDSEVRLCDKYSNESL